MNRIRIASIIITLTLGLGLTIFSRQESVKKFSHFVESPKSVTISQPYQKEDHISTQIQFISGELVLYPIISDQLYQFSAEYKLQQTKPIISYSQKPTPTLSIVPKRMQRYGFSSRAHWNLGLNTAAKHTLDIRARTGIQSLDLSNLALRHLQITTSAGFIHLAFNSFNPVTMNRLQLVTGTSGLRIFGLMNANAHTMYISSKAGNSFLDISGQQKRSSTLTLTGGIGHTKMIIAQNINTKIDIQDTLFTAISIKGFRKIASNSYVNPSFSPKLPILHIMVHLNSGKVTIQNQ